MWFAELGGGIGRITPSGSITEFTAPADSNPFAITAGADGNLWYSSSSNHKIGKVTPTGTITEVDTPAQGGEIPAITRGPDGNVWFLESGLQYPQLARITPWLTSASSRFRLRIRIRRASQRARTATCGTRRSAAWGA